MLDDDGPGKTIFDILLLYGFSTKVFFYGRSIAEIFVKMIELSTFYELDAYFEMIFFAL